MVGTAERGERLRRPLGDAALEDLVGPESTEVRPGRGPPSVTDRCGVRKSVSLCAGVLLLLEVGEEDMLWRWLLMTSPLTIASSVEAEGDGIAAVVGWMVELPLWV